MSTPGRMNGYDLEDENDIDDDAVPCDECDGSGFELDEDGEATGEDCPVCDGTGWLE